MARHEERGRGGGRRRRGRKRRRRRSPSDSRGDSRDDSRSSSDELFGRSSTRSDRTAAVEVARRHPGALLKAGLKQMARFPPTGVELPPVGSGPRLANFKVVLLGPNFVLDTATQSPINPKSLTLCFHILLKSTWTSQLIPLRPPNLVQLLAQLLFPFPTE